MKFDASVFTKEFADLAENAADNAGAAATDCEHIRAEIQKAIDNGWTEMHDVIRRVRSAQVNLFDALEQVRTLRLVLEAAQRLANT